MMRSGNLFLPAISAKIKDSAEWKLLDFGISKQQDIFAENVQRPVSA
jgi:hypothetical protein